MLCSYPAQGIIFLKPLSVAFHPEPVAQSYPAAGYIHGFGISRYSEFDPEASFAKAYEHAVQDLSSSMMTSVRLEFYGTRSLQPRLHAEFAIREEPDLNETAVQDSLQIGDWAVILLGHETNPARLPESVLSHPLVQNNPDEFLNPVRIGNYWIATGSSLFSEFDAYRSFTLAKQDALQNLSMHIQTVVQASQQIQTTSYASISYQTSRNVFSNIHVLKRERDGDRAYILIAVEEGDVYTWKE